MAGDKKWTMGKIISIENFKLHANNQIAEYRPVKRRRGTNTAGIFRFYENAAPCIAQ